MIKEGVPHPHTYGGVRETDTRYLALRLDTWLSTGYSLQKRFEYRVSSIEYLLATLLHRILAQKRFEYRVSSIEYLLATLFWSHSTYQELILMLFLILRLQEEMCG
jgi:hypothetical protein